MDEEDDQGSLWESELEGETAGELAEFELMTRGEWCWAQKEQESPDGEKRVDPKTSISPPCRR